jgi:hypothetical protein
MTYYEYIRAIRASDLDTNSKITAIMIASHYDFTKGERVWASNKTLAKETGLSVRSIVRAKRVLIDSHYLTSERQYNSVCLLLPIVPKSQEDGHSGQLNTHINTHIINNINTHINTNEFSNENSYVDSNTKKISKEDINIEWESDTSSLASFKAQAAAADNYWLKKADEIWSDYETN